MASSGVLTSVDLGIVTATDAEDGSLTPTADQSSPFLPGHHVITWSVTDTDNNTVTAEQIVDVVPLATFGPGLLAEVGSTVTLNAYLNGDAAKYPVTIEYAINGVPVADAEFIKIHAGTTGSIDYTIPDGPTEVVISMGPLTNAVAGDRTELSIQIVSEQVAPIARLHANQAGQLVRTIYGDNGQVVVTADVVDPNTNDTHIFDWSQTDSAILSAANVVGNQMTIADPSILAAGNYRISVVVTDTGVPATSTSTDLLLNMVEIQPRCLQQ